MKPDIAEMRSAVKKIAEESGLSLVLLFGSQARGKARRSSDFDFALLGEKVFTPREIARFSFLFSQAIRIKNEAVETTDLKSAPPLLLKGIARDAILLYEKEPRLFVEFKVYALKRYLEAKPLLELRRLTLRRSLNPV